MVDKLPFLPDEHHFALAAVAARSAQLDHHIEHTVDMLLRLSPNTSKYLLKNMGQDRIVGLLEALLRDAFPADADAATAFIKSIQAARSARNEVLHQIWGKAEEADKAIHVSVRPHRDHSQKSKTAAEISAIAADLLTCTRNLIVWQDCAHANQLESLRKTHGPQFLQLGSLVEPGTSPPELIAEIDRQRTPSEE
jgi:hypothetical protein